MLEEVVDIAVVSYYNLVFAWLLSGDKVSVVVSLRFALEVSGMVCVFFVNEQKCIYAMYVCACCVGRGLPDCGLVLSLFSLLLG